jgi:hypothetical protein
MANDCALLSLPFFFHHTKLSSSLPNKFPKYSTLSCLYEIFIIFWHRRMRRLKRRENWKTKQKYEKLNSKVLRENFFSLSFYGETMGKRGKKKFFEQWRTVKCSTIIKIYYFVISGIVGACLWLSSRRCYGNGLGALFKSSLLRDFM